jgi:predicted membrane channel-forming protein YqfA (hemolysin III family)
MLERWQINLFHILAVSLIVGYLAVYGTAVSDKLKLKKRKIGSLYGFSVLCMLIAMVCYHGYVMYNQSWK